MERGLIFYLLPTVVLPFHLSMIGGNKQGGTGEVGINVPGLTALFHKGVKRKGLEEETIECYCEGFIDGRFNSQGSCLEQLYCEKDSLIMCKKSGGCLKNTFSVQGKEFVVKFCGDSKNSDALEKKCKVRKANSAVHGEVELTECLCRGDHCNGSYSLLRTSTFMGNFIIWILTPIVIFISIEMRQPG